MIHPSIATAESCTGGLLSSEIVAVPGASKYFRGGVIAYTLDAKVQLLDVDRAHAEAVDCVSERVAREMAHLVRKRFDADIGVSTTGYAAPGPHQMAYVGISNRFGAEEVFRVDPRPNDTRNAFRAFIVAKAFQMLEDQYGVKYY